MTIHYYDKEALELMLRYKCPDCETQLIKKGNVKKECFNCGFYFKGDPRLIAYKVKTEDIEIIVNKKHTRLCPDCFSTPEFHKYYSKEDEIACLNCGLVLEGPPQCICDGVWVDYPYGTRLQWDIDISVEEIPLNMPDRTFKEFKGGYAGKLIKNVKMSYRLF